jgi:hypothetical protein
MRVSHRSARRALVGLGISTGVGLLFAVASSAAPPSLGVTATDADIGQTIKATAQLSESPDASGEISFEVFGPDDPSCSGPALDPAPAAVPVAGEGEYVSGEFTPPEAGVYRWSAHYSGDSENPAADSICSAASTVSKASPEVAGTASDGVVDTGIHDEATVTGGFSPTGEVIFRIYGPADTDCLTPLETDSVPLQGSDAVSADFLPQQAGEFRWTAEYAGDSNNEAAALPCGSANQASAVGKASPTLVGVATSAVTVGSPITDQVTVGSGFQAGGQLVFRAYGPGDQSCAGAVKYEATVSVNGNGPYSPAGFSPAAGVYRWTVSYAGDANNEAAALPCGSANQASAVGKASPTLVGVATSAVTVGSPITDQVTVGSGFQAGGQLVFRAYGPGDQSCAGAVKYEATVSVNGNGPYSPAGFSPAAGVYRWTVSYAGDSNNEAAALPCGSANQASAVGTITVTLAASATSGTVGNPVTATASTQEGATPTGQITFTAFSPGDTNCSGAAAFSSTVGVSGNGSYSSPAFTPSRVGAFRWTVDYSGDANHAPTSAGCGKATSSVSPASPSIASDVTQPLTVGTPFRVTATLRGGYAPSGTITYEIYRRIAGGCDQPVAVGVVPASGNGTFSSDPLVARKPGTYSFGATYSGDATNQGAIDPCDPAGPAVQVYRRTPQVKPRARLNDENQISIRARLSGAASPSGVINFRLYRPGDKQCKRKPAFSGGLTVKSNGSYLLAQYLATKPGIYRLSVGYSGDQRNRQYKPTCRDAQQIRIG